MSLLKGISVTEPKIIWMYAATVLCTLAFIAFVVAMITISPLWFVTATGLSLLASGAAMVMISIEMEAGDYYGELWQSGGLKRFSMLPRPFL